MSPIEAYGFPPRGVIIPKSKVLNDEIVLQVKQDAPINKEMELLKKNAGIDVSHTDFEVIKLAVCGLAEREREKIIQREINQKCLECGKSLNKEIMQKTIHIHLCTDCRRIRLDKIHYGI
jgi:DNA-directed RNA polymerase subunit RPC12/RpoP